MAGGIRESLLTCYNCKCIHAEYSLSFAFHQLRENKILIKPQNEHLSLKKIEKKQKKTRNDTETPH